jgi:predicted DNA binding protein
MRYFNSYPVKLVSLYLIHENCWSKYYLEDDMVNILNLIPYEEKNLLRVFLVSTEKSYKQIAKLKFEGRIRDIFNVYRYYNKILVDLARDYENSIFSIITGNNGIVLNTAKYNGGEIWNFLMYEHKINKTLKELDEVAEIENVNISDFIPISTTLSDHELKALSLAYEYGYFEYPRRIRSGELAKMLGIKQSTLIYHLRNAERKVIGSFLKKNRSFEE